MKKGIQALFLVLLLVTSFRMNATDIYRTEIFNNQIKTLQIKTGNDSQQVPYITLNGEELVEISFDRIGTEYSRYAYSIIHCNSDWTKSQLTPIEYMEGFQGMPIEDFANAIGTTTQYSNYRLQLPNEDVGFKVSGNYAIQVYDENKPGEILLTACFSVVEPMVNISASISGNTDIDTYQHFQQLQFDIHTRNFPIAFPNTDLKIAVYQNGRRDNAVFGLEPMNIREGIISYANNRKLIYPAGNEFRRMEFLSNKYNGMQVENISFHAPYYHVTLMVDAVRTAQSYQYDQDQNGRFLVRCSGCSDPDTEADYYIVHFALDAGLFSEGDVYIDSDLFHHVLNENSRMLYNEESGLYEKALLLKQGSYNYQYLYVGKGSEKGETAPIEGDFHQTENEYSIYVYYRPMGARYDRLIGFQMIKSLIQHL